MTVGIGLRPEHFEDAALVTTVIQGTMQAEWAKDTGGYRPGDVYLRNIPQAEFRARTHDVRSRSIVLPLSLLHAVAGAECAPPAPLRFLSMLPAGAAARAQWRNTSDYADRVLANPEAAASSLIIGSTARLLAATALTVFPNTGSGWTTPTGNSPLPTRSTSPSPPWPTGGGSPAPAGSPPTIARPTASFPATPCATSPGSARRFR